jgi:hypothetical protein
MRHDGGVVRFTSSGDLNSFSTVLASLPLTSA